MIRPAVTCRDLIGRVAEFGFLLDALRPDRPGPRVVVLRGEAGVGKTRLVRELTDVARSANVPVAVGTCWELAATPYTPFVEGFEALGTAEPARARFSEAAASALRVTDHGDAATSRTKRYAAANEAIAGDDAPRVLVVEDLHWADVATLDLFRHLGETLPHRGGLLLGTMRDETPDDAVRSRTLRGLERFVPALIEVRPLDDDAIARIVRTAALDAGRDVPEVVLADIVRLAEGRPYAAEELLRAFLDNKGAFAAVPPSIRDAIGDRLRALDEGDRLLLAHAAVVGRRFDAELVAELAEQPLVEVLTTLRRARNAQLIYEDDDGGFLFRHALTRDVVEGELLRGQVKLLHRAIAERLEGPSADPAIIAEHAWRGGDPVRTHYWNTRAGDAAAALHAHADAARYLSRAFEASSDAAERAALAERVGAEQHDLGDFARSAEWVARAADVRRSLGDERAARSLEVRRARILFEGGHVEEGIRAAEAVAESLRDAPLDERFDVDLVLAGLYTTLGRPNDALRTLADANAVAAQLPPEKFVILRSFRASTLGYLGQYAEARDDFAAALEADRASGNRDHLLRALNNAADLEVAIGDLAAARRLNDEALELARRTRAATHLPWLLLNAAQIDLFAGRYAAARAALNETGTRASLALVGHWWTALNLRLATLCGTDDCAQFLGQAHVRLDLAFAERDVQSIAIIAGAVAQHGIAEGIDIAEVIDRAIGSIHSALSAGWLLDAIPVALPRRIDDARTLLAASAARPHSLLAPAHLALFDARVALRRGERAAAREFGAAAAQRFADIGRPYERAVSLELAGDAGGALALLREIDAIGEARRRTEVTTAKRGTDALTAREREIGRLMAAGASNRAIAERLVIGERTVETHVANVMRKLGVTRRTDVCALLDP